MKYRNTSRLAWNSIKGPVSGALDYGILTTIDKHMPDGIICEKIEAALNCKHQSVSGNLRHLVEAGYADAGLNRDVTRSGRAAIKWVITPLGIWAVTIQHHINQRPDK